MLPFFPQSQNSDYRVYATLKGAQGPINSVVISEDGKLLASGGDDEVVRIWDLEEQKILEILSDDQGRWGQVTCIKWIESAVDAYCICFGTGRGLLLVYMKQKESDKFRESDCAHSFLYNDAVEAIAYNGQHGKLIASSHGGKIVMYTINKNCVLDRVWTKSLSNIEKGKVTTPQSVHFGNGGDSVVISGLESGTIFSKVTASGADNWSKQLKSSIGNSRLSPNGGYLLVDNLTRGFDVYAYPTLTLSDSFEIQRAQSYLHDGVFLEGSSMISCGSDHGQIYIFSCKTSLCIQKLRIGSRKSMIQTMDAISSGRYQLLAAGTSDNTPEIIVWRKAVKSIRVRPSSNLGCSPMMLVLFLNGIVLIAIFALLTSKLDIVACIDGLRPLPRLVKTNNPEVAYPMEAPNVVAESVFVHGEASDVEVKVEPVFTHGEASNAKIVEPVPMKPVSVRREASEAKVVEPVSVRREASNANFAEPAFVHVSSKEHDKPNRKAPKSLERYGNTVMKQGANTKSAGQRKRTVDEL